MGGEIKKTCPGHAHPRAETGESEDVWILLSYFLPDLHVSFTLLFRVQILFGFRLASLTSFSPSASGSLFICFLRVFSLRFVPLTSAASINQYHYCYIKHVQSLTVCCSPDKILSFCFIIVKRKQLKSKMNHTTAKWENMLLYFQFQLYPVAPEETVLHPCESESVGSEGKILTVTKRVMKKQVELAAERRLESLPSAACYNI